MSKESDFQADLIKELESIFEDSIVTKLDPRHIQGIPDLLILWKDKWATLECKKATKSNRQANQPYYVKIMDEMSFSRFISPENKEEVLDELRQAFGVERKARNPKPVAVALDKRRSGTAPTKGVQRQSKRKGHKTT